MKKSIKNIIMLFIVLMTMTSSSLVNVYAEEKMDDEVIDEVITEDVDVNETEGDIPDVEEPDESDACGDTLTWSVYNGVLRITGSGDMYTYSSDKTPPWHALASSITEVIIDSSVTSIDEYAFSGCMNIVVQCVTGSVAEQFCDSHGIQMIVHAKQECLDHVSTTIVNQKEATCKEEGYTGDEVCSICNTLIKQGQVINQLEHESEVRNAKEATYFEEGYTGDSYCIYCNGLLEEGTVIPKLQEKNKWVCTDGIWYHFNQDGNIDKNTWIQGVSDGKWYYVDETGAMVVSTIYEDTTGKSYCFNKDGQMVTGWQFVDGSWYYFYSDMKTDWQKIDNNWYYFNNEGIMQTGKITDSTNKTYYLGTKGNMETGWKQIEGKWYYFKDAMKTDWQKINNKWYYFDNDGIMAVAWKEIGNEWYYFNKDGFMEKGWKIINNHWYYLNSNMKSNEWVKTNGKWYYLGEDGIMVSNTITADTTGKIYKFASSGQMETGWISIGGKWYYFGSDRKTGWVLVNNLWFYMDAEGVMQTGTIVIDGKTYTFRDSGALTPNRYINATNTLLNNSGKDLRASFNWVVKNFTYQALPIPVNPPEGYTREQWYAVYGIENKKGNCYVFASAFTAAARALGYDARLVEGKVQTVVGTYNMHGWCEIKINGSTYICDPEAQYETSRYNFYMQPINNTVLKYVR